MEQIPTSVADLSVHQSMSVPTEAQAPTGRPPERGALWRRFPRVARLAEKLNRSHATPPGPPMSPHKSRRKRIAAVVAGVALVVTFATVKVTLSGRFYGLYLLTTTSGRPLEIKDDLRLGDGPRLVWGASFGWIRELISRGGGTLPRLELDWDAKAGGGVITNYLADREVVQTIFGRYVDSEGATPHGLFVGGAIAEVAAVTAQNQSGMALRDARGWHHLWCNVNEGFAIAGRSALITPGEWTFEGSRVLVDAPDRVVLTSEHTLTVGTAKLRMERYAYFKAGRPWFRLGVNVMNVGDEPVSLSYAYGDEPWVGEFGSAEGNYGWTAQGIATTVTTIDPRTLQWGGIVDAKTGLANFMSWTLAPPDLAYFGNHSGTPMTQEIGRPLASNEIFIGLEWHDRVIEEGEMFSARITLGLAGARPDGLPTYPEGALPVR
jgi:hypothetical protein